MTEEEEEETEKVSLTNGISKRRKKKIRIYVTLEFWGRRERHKLREINPFFCLYLQAIFYDLTVQVSHRATSFWGVWKILAVKSNKKLSRKGEDGKFIYIFHITKFSCKRAWRRENGGRKKMEKCVHAVVRSMKFFIASFLRDLK